jgi:uncharacterized membrane protein
MHHIIEVLHPAFDLLAGGAFGVVCRFISNAITHAIIFSSRIRTYHSRSCNENQWENRLQIRIIGVYLCVVQCLLRAFNSWIA